MAYTAEELYPLAKNAGFTGRALDDVVGIALAESSGNPNARYTTPREDSFGLLQINAKAWGYPMAEASLDPQVAFNNAYKISKGGTDFTPWTTYTSGKYRTGLHSPSGDMPRQGYYQGPGEDKPSLHVNIYGGGVDQPFPIDAALDSLLQGKLPTEAHQTNPLTLINDLLGKPQVGAGGSVAAAQPAGDFIEPPGPVPEAPNVLSQAQPLSPTQDMTPAPAPAAPVHDTVEPPAQGQPLRTVEAASGPMPAAPSLLDTLLSQTIRPMQQEIPQAALEIGQAALGIGERAALGARNIMRPPGTPIARAQVPVAPGLQRLADIGQFATGGLTSPIAPEAQRAAQAAGTVSRETAASLPALAADIRGGPRVEPPPLRGNEAPQVVGVSATNVPIRAAARGRAQAEQIKQEAGLPEEPAGGPPGGGAPPEPPRPPEAPREDRFPLLDPPVPGENVRQIVTRVDDALHRVLTNNTADKIDAKRWWDSLSRRWKDPQLRAFMADDIERRLIDPNAKLDPRTEAFLNGPARKLVAAENRIARDLTRLLGPDAKYADLPSAAEGYVHRIVETPPRGGIREEALGRLDPERGRVTDVVTGSLVQGRGRSLSKFAPGMQARARRFVLQDEAGNRVFQKRETLDDKGYEYGQTVEAGGQRWTVKPPTMNEMEANTPVRYIRDYAGNLLTNTLRLRRIKRNAELLADLKTELRQNGLFHEDRRMIGREGAVEKWVNLGPAPEGFARVNLPQMEGWAHPKIAAALNDFWNGAEGDLMRFLNNVNRYLVGLIFMTPVPHILNVSAHWAVGRGWDWLSIPGYIRGARAGARALNAVWNLTPEYTRMLREGSGLLYGDVAMENFYNQLMKKVWTEQLRNPEIWEGYAKSLGMKGVRDLVRAEYRWSRKTLWAVNDMLMLQRQFELEMRGVPTREAIRQAEKDIPNYRIPPEVLRSRTMALAMKSPSLFNFGRYHYGLMRALSEMMKDLVSPKATARERWEAAGKLTVLGTIGTLGFPALDALLQQVTGNPDATVRRFGPFGPLSSAGYLARDAYQKFAGQSAPDAINRILPGDKEWVSLMAPLMTPAPALSFAEEFITNTDALGRPVIDPRASQMGMGIQAGEAAARQIYPLNLGMQAMGPGGIAQPLGGLVGLNLPGRTPGPSGRTQKMLRGRAKARERRDPVQQFIDERMPRFSVGGQ